MFKPGSIREVTVHNFVTYENVTMYPGPQLNLLVGPNGSGKSTMVAAIILGLGGTPKVVGRGRKISEYVKHNCTNASIFIYLQKDVNSDTLTKITREFDIYEKSTWKINNESVHLRDILSYIKQYNIQVDNLCQFLPQDRVQYFAKMNKQELLKQTQIAICREDLLKKQQDLIRMRERHKSVMSSLEKNNEKLQQAIDANVQLENKVKNYKKKQKYLQKLQSINRKIAWVHYDQLKRELNEIKNDEKKAVLNYEAIKKKAEPMEQEIGKSKKISMQLDVRLSEHSRNIKQIVKEIRKLVERDEASKNNINQIENDKKMELMDYDRKKTEIDDCKRKLQELSSNREELLKQAHGAKNEENINRLNTQLATFNIEHRKLEDRKSELCDLKRNKREEMVSINNELERLENVKEQCFRQLYRLSKDAHTAVNWLRTNKHLFKGVVYEPMMLEINILDASKVVYVENMIAMRDKVAFTCTHKEDISTFISIVREQMHLNVNVIHSSDECENTFHPSIPIEELRKYGMYTYVNSLFTAPKPIMNYLCKNYNLHNTPVGTAHTNNYYDQLPKQVRVFYSDKYKFSITYSRYTGEKSTQQDEIKSDGSLSISVDTVNLERIQGRKNECQNAYEKCDEHIRDIDAKIASNESEQAKIREEIKQIRNITNTIKTVDTRIRLIETKITNLNQNTKTPDEIKAQFNSRIRKILKNVINNQKLIKSAFDRHSEILTTRNFDVANLELIQNKIKYLTNKFGETKNSLEEAQNLLRILKEKYKQMADGVKVALQKAKDQSNGLTPLDEGFERYRKDYGELPSSLEELQQEKDHVAARMECLNVANTDEIQDYQDRLNLIDELRGLIHNEQIELEELTKNIDEAREEWLAPLNEIVDDINAKFSSAFARMGFAGEVTIYTSENEKNFESYGLCIKVTFRNGVQLQELNTVVQSGGERAVATAAFMLSLQQLTPVPFRCVDEINQGMDATNEKKIFDFIVESTSDPQTSQYFLITPKLISNLKFCDTMKVHIVHNGPFLAQAEKWNGTKLCKKEV